MSSQKYFILAAAIGLGVMNGIYTFRQSLQEEKEKREGIYLSNTLAPQQTATRREEAAKSTSDSNKAQ